ncbi:hypothetical protein [uncultured Luteimonas sp.]|uniref:ArnT family glycosyltransferase n=1 Tax=uncultured Luteimonas sp. TaxID=453144 RepID=UPI00263026E2|nr:hypothetical protein [uncultured Luteimonas sp.]
MRTDPSGRRRTRAPALLVGAAALAVLLILFFRAFTLVPSFDGAMNLQVAWSVSQGDGYARSYGERAPFPREIQTNGPYILVAAAGYRLFGMGVAQSQLANVFFVLLLAGAAFMLARKVRGRTLDGFAAVLMLLSTPGVLAYGFRGFGEVPGLALAVGGLALYPWTDPGSRTRVTAAAMLLGAAVVTKTVMLVCVGPVGLVMALHAITRARAPAARTADIALLAAGFLSPIVVWEAYRMLSLGGADAYRAWWALEYLSISREAGIAETPGEAPSLPEKIWRHFGMLSAFLHLPTPLAMLWLLLPFGLAAMFPPTARHARWILLATLAAAAAYLIWWLALTPTPKAWHRRIFNGMALVNIAWILVSSSMACGAASRWRQRAAAVATVVAICFAAAFLMQSRMHGAIRPVDVSIVDRAVETLRSLPPDAPVYAAGWSSAPQISLLAGRALLDINDTPADELTRSPSAYLVVDQEAGHTTETRRVLAMYPSTALVPQSTLPQVYRFDPRSVAATPLRIDLTRPHQFNRLHDGQLAGFHKAEHDGRWVSADAVLRAHVSRADTLEIGVYVPPAERYDGGTTPTVSLSLDGCELPSIPVQPGLQTLEFPLAACSPSPTGPTTLRLRSSALIDSPITTDERSMAFLARSIQLKSQDPCTMFASVPLRALPAAVALAVALAACQDASGPTTDPVADGRLAAQSDTQTPALPWTLDETALAGSALQARRGPCAPAPYSAEVSWALQTAHGSQPELWIVQANQAPKLWVAPSQREGAKQTGEWLTDATVIYLVDGTADAVIARLRMAETPCDNRAGAKAPSAKKHAPDQAPSGRG